MLLPTITNTITAFNVTEQRTISSADFTSWLIEPSSDANDLVPLLLKMLVRNLIISAHHFTSFPAVGKVSLEIRHLK